MGLAQSDPTSELCRPPQTGTIPRVRPQLSPGLGPIFFHPCAAATGINVGTTLDHNAPNERGRQLGWPLLSVLYDAINLIFSEFDG